MSVLKETLAREIAPRGRDVKFFQSESTLPHVWLTLIEENINSAPVYDISREMWTGLIDFWDIIAYIINNRCGHFDSEERHASFSAQLETDRFLNQKVFDVADLSTRNPWVTIDEDATLADAIRQFVEAKTHRLVISSSDGQLYSILSQSAVVAFLERKLDESAELREALNVPASSPDVGTSSVLSVPSDMRAIDAFKFMYDKNVSGCPIVDKEGKVSGSLSGRDLKAIRADATFFHRLELPVSEFVSQVRENPKSIIGCPESATLREIVRVMNEKHIHRVYVFDAAGQVAKVVSLSDVIRHVQKSAL